jgi:hypothetical protein
MNFKILLAPTKNINPFPIRQEIVSFPFFANEAENIVHDIKKKNAEELSHLMSISQKIAGLNLDRFQIWKKSCGNEKEFHAIQMYSGEAFKAFDFPTLNSRFYEKTQETLFILSGLYGILKPFDLVYPYRLEMGLNYSPEARFNNLYNFWSDRITRYLNNLIRRDELIVNLASQEYSNVIDFKKVGSRVITPCFKELKKDKLSTVSIYSKNARGKMARFIIENEMKNEQDLKLYNLDGYLFKEELSTDDNWVFVR